MKSRSLPVLLSLLFVCATAAAQPNEASAVFNPLLGNGGGNDGNTHFSDNDGHTNAHWRPGRGKIDWVAILAALEAIGYAGPITLELEDAPGASHWTHTEDATPQLDDEMRRSIAYLRERHAELNPIARG